MRRLLGVTVLALTTGLALLAPAPKAFADEVKIAGASYRDMSPAPGGAPYRIFVWKPDTPPPEAGFPVVYVTDANAVFGTLVETMNIRSKNPGGTGVEPAVIVGLGYPVDTPFDVERRTYDLTPKADPATLPKKPNGAPWTEIGGADAFLAFIEDELKPFIEKDVKIDKSRETLVGHSFGGLFALHVLFTKPDAFDAYVAGSPSLWFGGGIMFREADAFVRALETKPVHARLLLAIGGWEQDLSPAEAAAPNAAQRAVWKAGNRMVDNVREMRDKLAGLEERGLDLTYREFPEEDHMSMISVVAGRALPFAMARDR